MVAKLPAGQIDESFLGDAGTPHEMDILGKMKIMQVLQSFNMKTDCKDRDQQSFEVIVNQKKSGAKLFALGAWTIVTVLTLGIVPTVVNNDGDITISKNGNIVAQENLQYTNAAWIGFFPKQISDNSKSVDLYHAPALDAVVGRKIGEMIKIYLNDVGTK